MMLESLETLRELLRADLNRATALIIKEQEPALGQLSTAIVQHVSKGGGKKLRPMLTLAVARALGYDGENHIYLAAAVEAIHTATLLHDDVIDGGVARRNHPTANVIWGNKASVLVGDYLFSKAFSLMICTENLRALRVLSDAAAVIVDAELWQLQLLKDLDVTADQYMQLITGKTAQLFAAACQVGAIVVCEGTSPHNEDCVQEMAKFGLALGKSFQIIDDYLDYFGEPDSTGKAAFQDFREGKMTLPLLVAMRLASDEDREILRSNFSCSTLEGKKLDLIRNIMLRYNVERVVLDAAEELSCAALQSLRLLPHNIYSASLGRVVTDLVRRRT